MSLKEEPSSSSPQYPTSDELMTALTNLKFPEDMNRLQDLHAGDHHGVVTGHDHSFVGEHHSHDSWFEHLYSLIGSLEDTKLDIVRVIGGGSSPWACVEGKATAKTKNGELRAVLPFIPSRTRSCRIAG